jgi:opacity protein-like surface antigen
MTKNRLLIAAACAATCFAGPAAAQLSSSAVYAGAQYGRMHYNKVCEGIAECEDRSNAGGAFLGLQFSRYMALEGALQDLGHASVAGGNVKTKAAEADIVVNFPLYGGFGLLGRVGIFHANMKGESHAENTNGVTYGWGAQYDFSSGFALRTEWQRHPKLGGGGFGAETDVDSINLGALVRFR